MPDTHIHRERIYYFKTEDGTYCAKTVNFPVIIQADSLDEIKTKAKALIEIIMEINQETLALDEPFELVEEKDSEVWIYGPNIVELKRKLQQYKDIFGEI